jgi:hypothetical protein
MAVEVMEMAGGSNDRRHEMIQRTQEVVPLTLDLVKEFLAEKDLKYLYEVLPLPSSKQGELKSRSFPIGALLGVCFYLREGSGRISY